MRIILGLTSKNVLDSVSNDEVLIRDQAHDRLLILLGNCSLLLCFSVEFGSYNLKRLVIDLCANIKSLKLTIFSLKFTYSLEERLCRFLSF